MKLKINIKYRYPDEDDPNVFEVAFYRGETLLHNVFYDIEGLSDKEMIELKREAVAKFMTCFPEISKEDIIRGFKGVDSQMYKLYEETFPS